MVKEIYSIGGFFFYSAEELAEFEFSISYPSDWEVVKGKPLRLSGLCMQYDDFVDYLDSLQTQPDICLAYKSDRARGHGFYTALWVNGLKIHGIFGYHESDSLNELVDEVDQFVSLSKWAGMKIRTNNCR